MPIPGLPIVGDFLNLATSRRDRDHAENTADRNYARSRADYLADREYDESYLTRLVKGAKDAGIHPLAALGVNGASGQSFHSPSSSVNAPSSNFGDPAIRAATIRNLDAQTDSVKWQTAASKLALTKTYAASNNDGYHKISQPQRTDKLKLAGIPIETFESSDAQTLEDRYGEIGGSVAGLANLPLDVIQTIGKLIKKHAPSKLEFQRRRKQYKNPRY